MRRKPQECSLLLQLVNRVQNSNTTAGFKWRERNWYLRKMGIWPQKAKQQSKNGIKTNLPERKTCILNIRPSPEQEASLSKLPILALGLLNGRQIGTENSIFVTTIFTSTPQASNNRGFLLWFHCCLTFGSVSRLKRHLMNVEGFSAKFWEGCSW